MQIDGWGDWVGVTVVIVGGMDGGEGVVLVLLGGQTPKSAARSPLTLISRVCDVRSLLPSYSGSLPLPPLALAASALSVALTAATLKHISLALLLLFAFVCVVVAVAVVAFVGAAAGRAMYTTVLLI